MKTNLHAINRFKKRIGIEITEDDLDAMNTLIKEGSEFVEVAIWEKGNEICAYKMKWNGLEFYAIYYFVEDRIISFKSLDQKIYKHNSESYD